MDETRAVSAVFFSVGLGILAQFFYVHDLWSLFHLSFYALLTAITIRENGGLKNLISGLDNWVAEIATHRNHVLIIENTNESIDTSKSNFTDTEIDMSQGDSNIITDDDKDELLPLPDDLRCSRLPQLPSSTTASCECVTFSAANVSNCYHRLLLPSSSIRATSANIVSHCRHHLPLLRGNTSAAITFHSFGLPSTSTSLKLSPIVFHCCYLFYFFVRHLLLPSSSTSWDFL
ncbi:hypothetical protein CDAR_550641 [Caerostris darwini]|uniref:Uncharacterized protein n=1 Tax=Caerostris darwini TaxID=1538125 RepID=A0AAV4NR78_9ARAC|nr:hypothetical protein CDAR_550641 [Caerostris darwini]